MNQNKEEREKKAEFEKLVLHYLEKQKGAVFVSCN
jgi:hypothetical protein